MTNAPNRYSRIIEAIFFKHYIKGLEEFSFDRLEIEEIARELQIKLPKNLGDLLYSFRYRVSLPSSIIETAPPDREWIILPAGRSRYKFVLSSITTISPSSMLVEIKILDSTPGIIEKYSLSDEQALLAKLRYNRLIDIFTGLTCYSLQNHLRTTVRGMGQVETDELYIGVDKRGALTILPIQAKGGKDRLGIVQIRQDIEMCKMKFPSLLIRSIAAQFASSEVIALFELEEANAEIRVVSEKHYRLVKPSELNQAELETYQNRTLD